VADPVITEFRLEPGEEVGSRFWTLGVGETEVGTVERELS